jgi:hypothetical protein
MMIKSLTRVLCVAALVGGAHLANAAVITEEYTGKQDLWSGDSFSFDFDLWNKNYFAYDTAPGMSLTKDGEGAYGSWSSANLYIDFWSEDPEQEMASIDLDAWTFRLFGIPLGGQDVLFDTITFSRPQNGVYTYLANYSLSPAQVNLLDNYGGGTLKLTATKQGKYENDFAITRVGLSATTGGTTTRVSEPSILALLAAALFGAGYIARRRRSGARG